MFLNLKNTNKIKRKHYILAFTAIAVVSLCILYFPHPAKAGVIGRLIGSSIENIAYSSIRSALSGISYICLWITSWFVYFAGLILDAAIHPLPNGIVKQHFVQEGWHIALDICNIFFAAFMLIISFSIILRIPSYREKQLLVYVIIIALLINFSMAICGVLIDASDIFTNYFIKAANTSPDGWGVSENIMNGLKLQKAYSPPSLPTTQDDTGDNGTITQVVIGCIMGTLMNIVASFTFVAAAILFLIRKVALSILVIFAPLAWVMFILPGTKSLFSKWWGYFSKYLIFAPVYAFFIYLAVFAINNGDFVINVTTNTQADLEKIKSVGVYAKDWTVYIQTILIPYTIIIIFLLAGLIISSNMGIYGANAIKGYGSGKAKKFKAWAGGKGKGAADWATSNPRYQLAKMNGGILKNIGLAGEKIGLKNFGAKWQERGQQHANEWLQKNPSYQSYANSMNNWTPAQLAKASIDSGPMGRIAKLKMVERGLYKDKDASKIFQKNDKIKENLNPEEKEAKTIRDAAEELKKLGHIKESKALQQQRWDAYEGEEQKKIIDAAHASGELNKVSSAVLNGQHSDEGLEYIQEKLGEDKLVDLFRTWGNVGREAMESKFGDPSDPTKFTDMNMKMREMFVKITGQTEKAFGQLEETAKQLEEAAKNFEKMDETDKARKAADQSGRLLERLTGAVRGLNVAQISKIKNKDNMSIIVKYMSAQQTSSAISAKELSGAQKQWIMENLPKDSHQKASDAGGSLIVKGHQYGNPRA